MPAPKANQCLILVFLEDTDDFHSHTLKNKHVSLLEELAPVSHFIGREEQDFSSLHPFSVLVEGVLSVLVLSPDCFRFLLVCCN